GVEERLRLQVAAVEADAGLSGLGRHLVRDRWLELLRARLRFEEFVRRYPEALEVELEPPVIVVGLPRSGTTHLVNLLAADRRFRSMPWWEIREPIPVLGDGPGPDG
ncbi:MAG: sulfotransferase, partial [Acidimicrobiales bacterium]|nr:sulfotransferase [Acidimicrobiales bacterium]